MKGLLLKDLYNLEKQARSLLLIFVFYLVFSLIGENSNMFGGVVSIMMVMLVITSLAYDERSRWDRYALTMPVSRKEMVLSKYLLGLILLTFALLINIDLPDPVWLQPAWGGMAPCSLIVWDWADTRCPFSSL